MPSYLTQPVKRAAALYANAPAIVDRDIRRNWREVADRVARLAGALHAAGGRDGARVAVLSMNTAAYFELHFAVAWAGAVLVPLNTRLSAAEIAYMLRDSAPAILIVDAENHQTISPALADHPDMLVIAMDGMGPESLEARLAAAEPLPDLAPGGEALAAICYTGGSTGSPKGVMLTHDNLVQNAVSTLTGVGYDRSSVYLHAAPMFHLTDGMATYSVTMAGGCHVFIPKFDAPTVLRLIEAEGVTNVTLVPTMIEMLVREAEGKNYDVSSLRQFQYGSSPMPEATLERALKIWPQTKYLHGWGMTELSPLGTLLPVELRDPKVAGKRLRSVGIPTANEEIRIVDEHGNDVPRGEVGEMIVRGPMVMKGYWNKPAETAEALRGGWMHTGDAAWQDEEGLYYIADRLKDMIISGGENVYSTEVESVVGLFPGVRQAAVFGRPHEKWGEEVCAAVLPETGAELDLEKLQAFVREKIAAYKVPKTIFIRTEPLPLTSAGKIFKKKLREEYQGA